MGPYLTDSLSRRVIFVTGKGGVGKSSVAWALASSLRQLGRKTAVASFGGFDRGSVISDIDTVKLETMGCFREYALRALRFEKLYSAIFENPVLKTFILAAPGLGDTVMAGKIWHLIDSNAYDSVVVDLPASGHAISFFRSLGGVIRLFKRGYVHNQAERILGLFESQSSRVDIVMNPSEFAVTEGIELHGRLRDVTRLTFGYGIMNQVLPDLAMPNLAPSPTPPDRAASFDAAAVSAIVSGYQMRKACEAQMILDASKLPIPLLKLPWIPDAPNAAALVTVLAGRLRDA